MATILAGDLNIHHRRWLVHSNFVSADGSAIFWFCCTTVLKQHVRILTRDNYLLDFIISDIFSAGFSFGRNSEHNMVLAVFDIGIRETLVVKRFVCDYAMAPWSDIQAESLNFDLSFIDVLGVDAAERLFDQFVFGVLKRHIRRREISDRKSVYSWINSRWVQCCPAGRIFFAH